MKYRKISNILVIVIVVLLAFSFATAVNAKNVAPTKNIFAERPLVHVLGPSPAITPSDERSAVDSGVLESCDILKDTDGTWYWYYHATSKDEERWGDGYRICVATAKNPLGPWKKYENNPVLEQGKEGEWDHEVVACACLMKVGAYNIHSRNATYYMWYWSEGKIGLATADNPLGPWKKYENNPVMDWGDEPGVYPGSVTKIDDSYLMFVQSPVSLQDQGPFCIATAAKPEGPWTKYEELYKQRTKKGYAAAKPKGPWSKHEINPVMSPGDWGAWDAGGFSEACARYHEGVFHCVYGGTQAPKIESLGYAWSFDAVNWHKYQGNPIVPLSRIPDSSGCAEVHCWVEGPYIYVFHTLRYYSGEGTARGLGSYPGWETEDLAVQILTIDPHFKIAFPILYDITLKPQKSTRLPECLPIGLEAASTLAIAVECSYGAETKAGLRLHIRASDDGVHCDTEDLYSFDIPLRAGKTVRKTFVMNVMTKFAKVSVENMDKSNSVKGLTVTATVGN